jgi:6-phosphofructo-2-kinase / fructose-2,6-biphosphatase 2
MSPEKARADFVRRIEEYERFYETVTEKEVRGSVASYMKIINVGRQVEVSPLRF